jgi:hypothetical protein
MYSNTSVGNNAIFGDSKAHTKAHTKALKIATGTNKGPFARIAVSWENQTVEQTEQEITRALEDSQQPNSTWKQIGFNPNRSGYFYDKANLKPVASASRVLQLGPLVMAQNVQYAPTEEANVMFSPNKPTQVRVIDSVTLELTDKEIENYNKLTEQNIEKFEFAGPRSSGESKGLYNTILAQTMSDEGIKFASEKGIPFSIVYQKGNMEYAGRWDVGRDQIVIDIEPFRASGGIVKDHLNRVILHEHGHFIMNRLLLMRMVNDKKVRVTWNKEGTVGSGNKLADITDFTPQFRQAFLSDMMKLGLNNIQDKKRLLDIAIQHDLEVTYGGSDGLRGSPSYDGRLEGYYDIIDAMLLGELHTNYNVSSGHGILYYKDNAQADKRFGKNRPYHEAAANLFEAKYNKDQFAWNRIKKDMPSLAKAFDKLMAEYDGQTKMFIDEDLYGNDTIVEKTHARGE